MALGSWDGDSEQWDVDGDAWDFAEASYSETVLISAAEAATADAPTITITETATLVEDYTPAAIVIPSTLSETCTLTETLSSQALPQGTLTEDIIVSAAEVPLIVSVATIAEVCTFSESGVPNVLVLETIDASCILGEILNSVALVVPEALKESVAVEADFIEYIDGWDFNHERDTGLWSKAGSRSDSWSKSGGANSDWQSDLPL